MSLEKTLSFYLRSFCEEHGYEQKCADELRIDLWRIVLDQRALQANNRAEYGNRLPDVDGWHIDLEDHIEWLDNFVICWESALFLEEYSYE